MSPLAFVTETREWFDGPIALSGAMGTGRAVRAARVLGADFGYIGTAFVATHEANAALGYKAMVVEHGADDIVYSNAFTGVHGNYLKPSIKNAGLDPEALPTSDKTQMSFATGVRRAHQAEGVEGDLGLRPGHRQRRQGHARRRPDRTLQEGIHRGGRSRAVMAI